MFNILILVQLPVLHSTLLFISFNAIYFLSTIYCTAVDHYYLVPLDLVRSQEAGTQFVSSPCMTHHTLNTKRKRLDSVIYHN